MTKAQKTISDEKRDAFTPLLKQSVSTAETAHWMPILWVA